MGKRRKSHAIYLLLVFLILALPFFPVANGNTLTATSRLQVQTFQSDFAYISWYFRTNTSDPQSSMVIVMAPNELINKTLPLHPSSLSINPINKEFDLTTNLTNFFIEGAIPIGTVSSDFPNDRYEANYFIGCNFIDKNKDVSLGGAIPGPTGNYQIAWSLTSEPSFESQLSDQTHFWLNDTLPKYSHWLRLNLIIFHRPPFSEYVGTLINGVPLWLNCFGVFLASVILAPVCYELIRKQPRKIKYARFIEVILIPIAASVIVFVPVYELALHVFETPLLVMKVEANMIALLTTYIAILSAGISLRIIVMIRERKPRHSWEENRYKKT
jgi:hypothetical protein